MSIRVFSGLIDSFIKEPIDQFENDPVRFNSKLVKTADNCQFVNHCQSIKRFRNVLDISCILFTILKALINCVRETINPTL